MGAMAILKYTGATDGDIADWENSSSESENDSYNDRTDAEVSLEESLMVHQESPTERAEPTEHEQLVELAGDDVDVAELAAAMEGLLGMSQRQ
jgi:hypothetical protein